MPERPIFGTSGLGEGDPRSRALGAPVNRGAQIVRYGDPVAPIPTFPNGLGVGDARARAWNDASINTGSEIIRDQTPVPPQYDPNVRPVEQGYGGDHILGVRPGDDPRNRGATLITPDPKDRRYLPPGPPPMTGMARHSRPEDPAVYGTDALPENRVRTYGGAQSRSGGLGDTVAAMGAAITGLQRQFAEMAMILKKLNEARPAAPRKAARRRTSAKKV